MSRESQQRRGGSIRMAAGALVFASVLAGGCGGRSEKATGEHGADQVEPLCRKFAARYTTDNGESTCSFDRDALSLVCETADYGLVTTTWTSIDAALEDNHPIGRITASHRRFVMPEVTLTETITYDAAGRPTASQPTIVETPPVENESHGSEAFEYSAWDAEKRPTRASVWIAWEGAGRPPGGCGGQEETREYDDANRKVVANRAPGGGPLCQGTVRTWTFDADGILLSEGAAGSSSVRTYVTLETGEICRD